MQVVAEHAPVSAETLESPLMLWTSEAVSSLLAAGADPPELLPRPGMFGKVSPPLDGVGVVEALDPPQAARPLIAPSATAPTRSDLMVIEFLAVVCQRSLRAEFAADHSGRNSQAHLLPDREIDFTLVQSKS
jgi:hypothetical protein